MKSRLQQFFLGACLFATTPARAAELGTAAVAPTLSLSNAWNEAEAAIKKFRVPPGFKLDVFAVEPQLANPVSFSIDERGRIFVAETHHYRTSVLDIRNIMDWYNDDLACRTVEDRIAMIKKHRPNDWQTLGVESESIRMLEDTDGDGRADVSTVYAEGFSSLLDGIASGTLARNGKVYFANIPEITLLEGISKEGKAEKRSTLSTGYGVRFSLTGHDLHGLRFGPDGRLYFSMGDRGSHVVSKEGKVFDYPDEGSVYRCEPDGKNLEVFATGLRNPQELAFDDLGNLITGDNNCDHGDAARIVYVVEGSDTGWRVGYQFSETNPAGVWNAEKLWHLRWPKQAAYILPPIGHLSAGPSGLTYYPGTGFSEDYKGHFFLCDFRGQATSSGIHTFTIKPEGGGYLLDKSEHFLWDILATDTDFGPDGRLYVSDWVHGWPKSERGRIYRLTLPDGFSEPINTATRRLLLEGFEKQTISELGVLLSHRDQRVRQEAQFALAARGSESITQLHEVLRLNEKTIPRLHALWAFGQIGRRFDQVTESITRYLEDRDPEVRAQTAKILGETGRSSAIQLLIPLLKDPSPRVQMFAAIALSKFNRSEIEKPAKEMLRANDNKDLYVRHGGVMALASFKDSKALAAIATDASAAVRMGAVLALRRQRSAEIAAFLNDKDATVALEAARAINDLTLTNAMSALAAQASVQPDRFTGENSELSTPWLRRVMNANFRSGTSADAERLIAFAKDNTLPEAIRAEALLMLGQWAQPSQRDKVSGLWRPLNARSAKPALDSMQASWPTLLKEASASVQKAAIRAAASLQVADVGSQLEEIALGSANPATNRVEALRALAALKYPGLAVLAGKAASDSNETVRKEGVSLQASAGGAGAADRLAQVLESGSISEKQNAFVSLGTMPGAEADALIFKWLSRKDVPDELQLDVLMAAEMRKDAGITKLLAERTAQYSKTDNIDPFRVTLKGGNQANGRKIFYEKAEAACNRCHKMQGDGGEVGPELTHLAEKQNPEYLLESILYPNAKIAQGFESVLVTSKTGTLYAGVLKSETDTVLEINSPEDGLIKVNKSDIDKREKGLSGMPEGFGTILSRQEIRDIIAFLTAKN